MKSQVEICTITICIISTNPSFPCCLAVMANCCKTAYLQRFAFIPLKTYLPCFDASFFKYRVDSCHKKACSFFTMSKNRN